MGRHVTEGLRAAGDTVYAAGPDPARADRVIELRPRVFDLPRFGRRRLYRTDFSDQHTLSRKLGLPVRTSFALDARVATVALAALTRIPGGSRRARSRGAGR